MSKVADSPAVCARDSARPVDELSLLQTPTVAKTNSRLNEASRMQDQHNSMLDPDHYVFKLKFEEPDNFLELVISHLSRFLDLPGDELEIFRSSAEREAKSSSSKVQKKSWSFMKKKEQKGTIFGASLTEDCLVQIQHLMEYLSKHLEVEGLFRKPGNSNRLQQLRAALNTGVCVDLESSRFHSHDVASVLKTFLGELAEPVLLHKYFKAHLQIADMMAFDSAGNLTQTPAKAKRVETLQLLLLLLPTVNRTLLRGILNLLFQTAKNQKSNKMNASNLATMFCPHLLWPRNLKTTDFQNNIGKLNDHMAFMIRHSQKIFIAPQYIRDAAEKYFNGSSSIQHNPNFIYTPSGAVKRTSSGRDEYAVETRSYTEKALKELFTQVNNMPNSAKKKRIVKNMEKQQGTTPKKNHKRSRTFGGMIKKKVLSVATPSTKIGSDETSKTRSLSVFHLDAPATTTAIPRTQPVLMRRKSVGCKKTDKSIKESFFRRSVKPERRSKVISTCDDADVVTPEIKPIPFPTLDDSEEKENETGIRESTV